MQRVHGICIFYSLFFVRGTAQCSSSATCRSRGTMKIFTQIFGDREDYIQETLEPDILSKLSEFISSKQLRCGVLLSIRTQLQIKNYWGPWISILFADVAVYADVAHIELLAHNQLSPSTHLASQSSLDTHNQAYGLKCNRKSRVLRASNVVQLTDEHRLKVKKWVRTAIFVLIMIPNIQTLHLEWHMGII